MNKIMLIGRNVKDIEIRNTDNNKDYTIFTIAVDRIKSEETDFISCIAWDKKANFIKDYVKKGDRIAIEGKLRVNTTKKAGEFHTSTLVNIDTITLLEYKNRKTE